MSYLQVLDLPVDHLEVALVAVPFFSDRKPLGGPVALLDWRLNGLLTRQLSENTASGVPGDRFLVKGNHKVAAEWVMFVGCGPYPGSSTAELERVVGELLDSVVQAGFRQVGIGLPFSDKEGLAAWQEVLYPKLSDASSVRLRECQLSACDESEYVN